MTSLTFKITFHTPFMISTGLASDALDLVVDQENPFPGTALKGLLRAHARHWLKVGEPRIEQIFGSAGLPSPWIFPDVEVKRLALSGKLPKGVRPTIWNRVHVDPQGRAQERALVSGEQVWASTGKVRLTWTGQGEAPPAHVLVLRAAARDVVSIGMNRRRGFGWVSIHDDREWTLGNSKDLLELTAAGAI